MSHAGGFDDPGLPPPSGVRPFLRSPRAPIPDASSDAEYASHQGGDPSATLRPFVITAGRTDGPDPDIHLETQVTVSPGAFPMRLSPEKRAIVSLCFEPLSVAEISARLHMHLGVTRILVGDLRAAGQLEVHVLNGEFPDPETIMRVIRGLRSIS